MNRDREAIAVRASELFSDEFCSAFDWPEEQADSFFEKVGLMVSSAVERAFDDLALPVGGGAGELLSEAEQVLTANRDGDGSRAATDRIIKRLRAALSPTTLGGES